MQLELNLQPSASPKELTREERMNVHLRAKSDKVYGRVLKAMRKMPLFQTVSRAYNKIVSEDKEYLYIQSSRVAHNRKDGDQVARPFKVPKAAIQAAIDLVLEEGMVALKDLEGAHRHTSAIGGIVVSFVEKVKVFTLKTRKVYLRYMQVHVHIGGVERSPAIMDLTDQAGGARLLMSFYHIRNNLRGRRRGQPPAWYRKVKQLRAKVLGDSGGFTFWKNLDITPEQLASMTFEDVKPYLDEYITFQKSRLADAFCGFFALDVVGNEKLSKEILLYMMKQGLRPIPIYHLGDSWEYLDWLVSLGLPLIGLGGHVGRVDERTLIAWLKKIFDRHGHHQAFHGLGIGSVVMGLFPWRSVDSTSYLVGRKMSCRSNNEGPHILTDWGQMKAPASCDDPVAHNVRWLVQFEDRAGDCFDDGGFQLNLLERLHVVQELAKGLWSPVAVSVA